MYIIEIPTVQCMHLCKRKFHLIFLFHFVLNFSFSCYFWLHLLHMCKPEDQQRIPFPLWVEIMHMWAAHMNTPSKYVNGFWCNNYIFAEIFNQFPISKGLYGQNVQSSYSKAVDSAHSSVRVSSSRQSNDILGKYIIPNYVPIQVFVTVFVCVCVFECVFCCYVNYSLIN